MADDRSVAQKNRDFDPEQFAEQIIKQELGSGTVLMHHG